MIFNSAAFAVFLPSVLILYWLLQGRPLRWQNGLLLVASYTFYGWWDYRFLSLIALSSVVDFSIGAALSRRTGEKTRRALVALSLGLNLGILGIFKYFNFFVGSFAAFSESIGLPVSLPVVKVILPVGISFYTFQTLSYTIDVYRRKIEPTRDVVAFFAFVSFFPQLVAGPIERAGNLLPQFEERRRFDIDLAKDGLRQMLWGLFKKTVVADNLAHFVDAAFSNPAAQGGAGLAVGAFAFAIQIYCDFSGYSDLAIGTARLFGFRLMRNFAFPYFSRDIAEFWRRWHISLSSWFRDYLYIPLGGSRAGTARRLLNVVIIFVLSGLWHGANWTFVAWGLLHGLCYLPLVLSGRHKQHLGGVAEGRLFPSLRETFQIGLTFLIVTIGWVFFRADTIGDAFFYIGHFFSNSLLDPAPPWKPLAYAGPVLAAEWVQRARHHALEIGDLPLPARWAIYYLLIAAIFFFGSMDYVPFIYFQF